MVLILGKLPYAFSHNLRFLSGISQPTEVATGIVSNELQEKGHILLDTLLSHLLNHRLFLLVDRRCLEGGVLDQQLDAYSSLSL